MSIPHPFPHKPKGKLRAVKPPHRALPIGAADPWTAERITAVVVGVDAEWRAAESKWGVGRLPVLVSDTTRLQLRQGMDKWQAAIADSDAAEIERLGPLIRGALKFMDGEAARLGAAPLAVNAWEVARDDGTVVVIVRTGAEASVVVREGREVEVWTLEEVARVLPRGVGSVKRLFPGAKVRRVATHHEGYGQEWVTGDPILMGDPIGD